MEFIKDFIDLFLHLDKHLSLIIQDYGLWTYLILFLIIFCETGLVVTPLLPGDSLLFAVGNFAALGAFEVEIIFLLLAVAAVLGDTVNYWIGHYMGPKVFNNGGNRFLKKEYLDKTHSFYERFGGKTIVFARFVPIVRTFAPFVAGVGAMSYGRFFAFNVAGGIAWIGLFIFGGFYFGSLPIVKNNFTLVILGIIFVSILPGIIEYLRHRAKKTA